MSPLGVRSVGWRPPNEAGRAHVYLGRVHQEVAASGEIVVFNRSHYEDLLVPVVQGTIDETDAPALHAGERLRANQSRKQVSPRFDSKRRLAALPRGHSAAGRRRGGLNVCSKGCRSSAALLPSNVILCWRYRRPAANVLPNAGPDHATSNRLRIVAQPAGNSIGRELLILRATDPARVAN